MPEETDQLIPAHTQPEGRKLLLLSVVVPCYNESEVIGLFYAALKDVLNSLGDTDSEIIFVDDGSHDDTLDKLNQLAAADPTVRVCSLSRNFGHQMALTAGLDHAEGDAVVMLDSDLQHPPTLIPELIRKWRAGYEVVSAIRESTDGASWFKNFTSSSFYRVLNFLSSTQIPDGAADFCLISRHVRESIEGMRERHRFLRGMVSWVGFSRAFVPFVAPRRAAGTTSYSTYKMVAMALDATFSFSSEPLRLVTKVGVFVFGAGFVYLAINLIKGFIYGNLVPGYASLIGVVTILAGCQIVFLGLIGQYLARVFEEVKDRPLYLLKQAPSKRGQGLQREEGEGRGPEMGT